MKRKFAVIGMLTAIAAISRLADWMGQLHRTNQAALSQAAKAKQSNQPLEAAAKPLWKPTPAFPAPIWPSRISRFLQANSMWHNTITRNSLGTRSRTDR